ncbi:acyltransferase [Gordonia terrae]
MTIEVDGHIGDGTLIANNVGVVGRLDHDFRTVGVPVREAPWVGDVPELSRQTLIGSDVWLGFGAIVLSGVTIGDSSIVAAGQVVREDVPDNTIVAGASKADWRTRFSDDDYGLHWARMSELGIRRVSEHDKD